MVNKYDFQVVGGVTLQLNETEFPKQMAGIEKALNKSQPALIKTQISGVNAGQAQNVLDGIRKQATSIDSVVVKSRDVFKKSTQVVETQLLEMVVSYTNKMGVALTKTESLASAATKLEKGDVVKSRIKGEIDYGKQVKLVTDHYKERLTTFDKMSTKAVEYSTRAEKMSSKEKEGIQNSAKALQNMITEYNRLLATGGKANLKKADLLAPQIEEANKAMNNQYATSQRAAVGIRSWGESLANAVKQSIVYSFSIGLVMKAQELLNQSLQYTISLNKEMTNIQVLQAEGAKTDAEIRSLAGAYNQLAKEMHVSTLEIASGSTEWLRQGRTIAETKELLKVSTTLSKLGAVEAGQATEYLTSTLNSYGMAATQATGIVDKLIAVDNKSATSSKELAIALRYVAAQAKESGVSIEQLISYVGVISSVTRLNAESIGQSLKTIFTRMEDIKAGAIDEDGLGINNVEMALARANIALRNADGSWRDLGTVLQETSTIWSSLSDVEQKDIAKAMAGTRQRNMLTILMTNMNQALDLQKEQYNSAGLAAKRYEIYLNSVEGSHGKVKASLEGLFMSFSKFDNVIVWVNKLISKILDLTTSLGGLPTILKAIASLMLGFNAITIIGKIISIGSAVIGFVKTLGSATAATAALTGAIAPLAIALGAFVAFQVVDYLINLSEAAEKAAEKASQLRQSLNQTAETLRKLSNEKISLSGLWENYNNLSTKIKQLGDVSKLTADEQKEFYDIQSRIAEISPSVLTSFDEEGHLLLDESVTLEKLVALKQEEIEISKEKLALDIADAIEAEALSYDTLIKKYDEVLEKQKSLKAGKTEQGLSQLGSMGGGAIVQTPEEIEKEINKAANAVKQSKLTLKQEFAKMGTEARESFIEGLRNKGKFDIIEFIFGKTEGKQLSTDRLEPVFREIFDLKKQRKSLNDIAEGFNEVAKSINDYGASSQKTYDSLQKAIGEGIDISEYLTEQGDVNLEKLAKSGQEKIEVLRSYLSDTRNVISDEERSAIENLISQTETALNYQQTSIGNGIQLTGLQYQQFSADMSTTLYNAAVATHITFTDINGVALTSAENIKTAMINNVANYDAMLAQLASKSVNYFNMVQSYGNQLGQYLTHMTNYVPTAPVFTGGSGGSGANKAKNEEKERIKAIIDSLNQQKKALEDQLKAYNKYIDAQKKSLELQKEEADFQDELADKNKDLAKLKTQIAVLALDNSDEARARRLELEEEAGELEHDITEDTEDRKYDLKIEALDEMQQAFEDNINAQIDGIENSIEAYQRQSDAIDETTESTNSATGATGGLTKQTEDWGVINASVSAAVALALGKQKGLTEENTTVLQGFIEKLVEQGRITDDNYAKMDRYAQLLALTQALAASIPNTDIRSVYSHHSGGKVESHHDGDFAGNLKSNEVFSKLLEGEYVATEGQMNNFMKNILPKIASSTPSVTSKSALANNTAISMPITVEGNMDKSVLPDLKEMVTKVINDANKIRGVKRTVNAFSV